MDGRTDGMMDEGKRADFVPYEQNQHQYHILYLFHFCQLFLRQQQQKQKQQQDVRWKFDIHSKTLVY